MIHGVIEIASIGHVSESEPVGQSTAVHCLLQLVVIELFGIDIGLLSGASLGEGDGVGVWIKLLITLIKIPSIHSLK